MDETYFRKYLIVSKVGGFGSSVSTAKYFVSRQTYILIERQNSEEFNKTQKFSVSRRTSEISNRA